MDLRPLNLADARVLSSAYAIERAAGLRLRPQWVPLSEGAVILAWQASDGWDRAMLGAFTGATLLGFAISETFLDEAGTSWINISVTPDHQGLGVGTALGRAIENVSPPQTNRFVAQATLPSSAATHAFTERFARPLDYTVATTETVVDLDLRSAHLPAPLAPEGYTVSTYVNGVPERLRAEVGRIKGLVDAEAPNGDLDWTETEVSPAQYLAGIELATAQGRIVVESVALAPNGAVVAWTCLLISADPRRPATTEGTLVVRQHRGHRLGLAVKTSCLTAAREHGAISVKTSSDDENVWMRSLNSTLGFTPSEAKVILQKRRTLA